MVIQQVMVQGDILAKLGTMQNMDGSFSIRKMYLHVIPQHPKVPWQSLTLQQNIHPRVKFMLWLAMQNRLATVDRLQMIGIQAPMACVFFHSVIETHAHLFFECQVTGALWLRLLTCLGHIRIRGDAKHEMKWACSMAKRKNGLGAITSCTYAMAVYVIWRERNLLRFQKSTYDEDRVSREIAIHIHIRGQNLRKWRKPLSLLSSYP
ncbi:PREDICTED: uncharacterized protein LOC109242803 [Nicotiana attenuata]|uniref:uncharacterized protein LOC109242803 n=1 Tax=Nicotiana attenuata TaxID=49451 RepID=UPI000904DA6E|nr:PREDICTED: uncharacterized protein LOC109242803 [Nicotiana attenuata]